MSRRTCIAMLPFILCQHRLSHKQKKKNQFPFHWCAVASGVDHIWASELSATALENGFGTKCEEHPFSSNCNNSTLTWPETYLTSVKNATGSVITTDSTFSLTKRKVPGVLWEGKPKKMSFLHGRKLRPAVLHYLPLHDSAGTPNNLCSCTTAPSFTLLLCFLIYLRSHIPETPFPTVSNMDEWEVLVHLSCA